MNTSDTLRFELLRLRLFEAIGKHLALDGHCKRYEGAFRVIEAYPNYFETRSGANKVSRIELDCYLVGPSRHYSWEGSTITEALDKSENDINKWMEEDSKWFNEEYESKN